MAPTWDKSLLGPLGDFLAAYIDDVDAMKVRARRAGVSTSGTWAQGNRTIQDRWFGLLGDALDGGLLWELLREVHQVLPAPQRGDLNRHLSSISANALVGIAGRNWVTLQDYVTNLIDSENLEERLAAVRGIRTVAAGLVKLLNDEITVLSVIPQGVSDRGTREIRDLLVNRSYNVLVAANYMLELARRRTNVSEDSDEYGPGVVLAVEEARQGFSDAEHRRIEVASITVDQQARRLLAGLRGKIGRLES